MSAVLTRPWRKSLHHRKNCSTWHTLIPIHILHSIVNVGSTNTFCRQKLDYCALSLFGGIHGTIVNCYLASASVNNTLPLSSVYQISPDIHCHLPGKSQSSTAGNNSAPTSVPLSLGHALYNWLLLQVIYMMCALLYPEEKGGTFFKLFGITCTVTQHHIPINKYLEKLHDLKLFLHAISFNIPREFIKYCIR